ncbi:NAD(P)H-dependent glycerol-3-phosphate dehydrogenase [Halanaerobium hydrogeniformans]|nr:NAD(P)H-dependent glycerol-3-phosphate dehydrogenase [Halanaerobium hydrogeniformans]
MKSKITVIGGGSWGTSLANILAENGHLTRIYARDKSVVDSINEKNINHKYFPEIKLHEDLKAVNDFKKAVSEAEVIVISVPTHAAEKVCSELKKYTAEKTLIVSTAKGIEEENFKVNSEIIKDAGFKNVVVLSGPTHAEEVIKKLPTAIVSASRNKENAEKVQDLFMSPYFRVYTNPDLIGVELGGAVKNVIALASGICDGLDFGDNTRAALITRALMEMGRFVDYHGGKKMTLAGLSGMGDLVVTCTSMHSRNRRFGIEIGKGKSIAEAKDRVKQVVEGVKTTRAIYKWLEKENLELEMPITYQVYNVLFNDKDPYQAVDQLMLRSKKHEMEAVVDKSLWNI